MVLQIFILVVLIFTLRTYRESNTINKLSHVPWLNTKEYHFSIEGDTIKIAFKEVNDSDSPGFDEVYDFKVGDHPMSRIPHGGNAEIPPHSDQPRIIFFQTPNNAEALSQVTSGAEELIFTINYEDIFGNSIAHYERFKMLPDGTRDMIELRTTF